MMGVIWRLVVDVLFLVGLIASAVQGETALTVGIGALMVTRAIDGLRMDLKNRAAS